MKNHVYLNGRIVSEKETRLSPLDRGLTLGDGIFETVLARKGRPVFLDNHMGRLCAGLKALGFEKEKLENFFADIEGGIITELLGENKLDESTARVRITITRGLAEGGLSAIRDADPTTIITTAPVDMEKIREKREQGITAITIKGIRPALPGVKTTNFMPNIIAAVMARGRGAGEAFFLGTDNKTVLEGTTSNVFIVSGGRLFTPPAATRPAGPGALAGVVRQTILELAKESKINAMEDWFTVDELYHAGEAFITNSISGLVPVVKTDDCKIENGRPGKTTRTLQKKYEEKIMMER